MTIEFMYEFTLSRTFKVRTNPRHDLVSSHYETNLLGLFSHNPNGQASSSHIVAEIAPLI